MGSKLHLVDVPDVDIDISGADEPDAEWSVSVEGPERAGVSGVDPSGAWARLGCAAAVGWSNKATARQLIIHTVLTDQHEVWQLPHDDTTADVLHTYTQKTVSERSTLSPVCLSCNDCAHIVLTLYWLSGYFSSRYSSQPHTLRMYCP